LLCCFFFSSRRRHTRSTRDWSSDVCSSDLTLEKALSFCRCGWPLNRPFERNTSIWSGALYIAGRTEAKIRCSTRLSSPTAPHLRSEERRVGKDCTLGCVALEY